MAMGEYDEPGIKTSSAYLTGHVAKSANILDVGCGSGIITAHLARLADKGHTIGIDNSRSSIDQAKASFPATSMPNINFVVGDTTKLVEFADNTFDIVHAHMFLVRATDPIAVFKEFYRVCKPGGFVACRELNHSSLLTLKPDLPSIRHYLDRGKGLIIEAGMNLDAGSKLETWAKEAGFGSGGSRIDITKSPMPIPGQLDLVTGDNAERALKHGIARKEEIDSWAASWSKWDATEGKEFVLECQEIICWKS